MPALPNTLSFSQSRRWIVKLASTFPDIPFHWQRGQPRRLVSRTATEWASNLSVATDSSPSGDQDKSVAYQFGALAVGVLCGVALLVVIVVAWFFVVRRGVLDKDVEETTRYLSLPSNTFKSTSSSTQTTIYENPQSVATDSSSLASSSLSASEGKRGPVSEAITQPEPARVPRSRVPPTVVPNPRRGSFSSIASSSTSSSSSTVINTSNITTPVKSYIPFRRSPLSNTMGGVMEATYPPSAGSNARGISPPREAVEKLSIMSPPPTSPSFSDPVEGAKETSLMSPSDPLAPPEYRSNGEHGAPAPVGCAL